MKEYVKILELDKYEIGIIINALNDLIITSDFKNMYNEVLTNIENKKIKKSTVNQAVKRVIAWKYAYGLY